MSTSVVSMTKLENDLKKAIKSKHVPYLENAIRLATLFSMPVSNYHLFMARKELFTAYMINKKQQVKLSKKKEKECRIAIFNVHYFTDVHEKKNTYNEINKDIKDIDADIIGLQEFVFGNVIQINKDVNIDTRNFYNDIKKNGYTKTIVCNSVPSWYDSIYGNIVLIKNTYCNDIKCEEKHRAPLDETIFTFNKSKKATICSGNNKGQRETRCYIKLLIHKYNKHIYIYVTHLDVATEKERLSQIKHIIHDAKQYNKKNDIVLIIGDFNSFDKDQENKKDPSQRWKYNKFLKDNGKVVSELKKYKYCDVHKELNAKDPKIMTAWNNTRVDFMFCNKPEKKTGLVFRPEYYYTTSSDHIPVVLTLSKSQKYTRKHRSKVYKTRRQ